MRGTEMSKAKKAVVKSFKYRMQRRGIAGLGILSGI